MFRALGQANRPGQIAVALGELKLSRNRETAASISTKSSSPSCSRAWPSSETSEISESPWGSRQRYLHSPGPQRHRLGLPGVRPGTRRRGQGSGGRRGRASARYAGGRRESVAQLDRAQRVEAQFLQHRSGSDLPGRGMAEDLGRLAEDELKHDRTALAGGARSSPARKAPARTRGPRAVDQAAQYRRQQPRLRLGPQGRAV